MIRSLARLVRHPRLWTTEHMDDWFTRKLASCPAGSTNSTARDEWVQAQLSKVPAGWRILDAGSGEQRYRPFCLHLNYVSQDHEAYDGKGDGIGGHVPSWTYGKTDHVCDIISIPEPDKSFDVVLCTEVLEHVPDPVLAIEELARLVRPGGILIVTVPFCSFTHFAPYHFSTGLSRYWYEEHLGRLGFGEVVCEASGNYFEYVAQEIRRLGQVTHDYTGQKLPWFIKIISVILLRFLARLSQADKGSGDYACYGWHVRAFKATDSSLDG